MQNFCKLKLFGVTPIEVFRQSRLLSQGFLPFYRGFTSPTHFYFFSPRQKYFKIAKCTFLAKILKRQLAKYWLVYAWVAPYRITNMFEVLIYNQTHLLFSCWSVKLKLEEPHQFNVAKILPCLVCNEML